MNTGCCGCSSTQRFCDVGSKLGISEDVVTGTIDRWISTQVEWDDFVELKVLGIDEISLKRGHRDFVWSSSPRPRLTVWTS